jgi:hypothetical protein
MKLSFTNLDRIRFIPRVQIKKSQSAYGPKNLTKERNMCLLIQVQTAQWMSCKAKYGTVILICGGFHNFRFSMPDVINTVSTNYQMI